MTLSFRFTAEGNALAIDLYERALALTPEFVSAHTGLGWRHLQAGRHGWAADRGAAFARAREQARIAGEIDPDNAQVYGLLVGLHLFSGAHREAA